MLPQYRNCRTWIAALLSAAVVVQSPVAAIGYIPQESPTPVSGSSQDQPADSFAGISPASSSIQDVRLRDGGIVTVQIVDLQGNPVVGEHVSIEYRQREIASAVSDDNGLIAVQGLRPGLHTITTPLGASVCRLWDSETAPPSAVTTPAVVSDAELVRGQFGAFNLPMVVYAGISIAALIIAVDANNTSEDAEAAANALAARVRALENASP